MKHNQNCILVYNPISGHGHLDSWNAIFIELLLKQGWYVLALTPDTSALMSRLNEKGVERLANLQVLDWNAHRPYHKLRDMLLRGWHRWDKFGDRFFYRRVGSEVHPDMAFQQYWTIRLYQWTVPFLFRVSHFLLAQYQRCHASSTFEENDINTEKDMTDPKELAIRTNAALRKAKWTPALALNMYMDTYATRSEQWNQFAGINSLSWIGIRFVPTENAHEGWYALSAFVGMFFLDKNVCKHYQRKFPKLHVTYLPDITDTALPLTPESLVLDIKRRAAGRKIVFLGGSIGGQKNLSRWFEVITQANPTFWFFVQVGEIHHNTLTAEDTLALERVLASPIENLLIHEGYLPDERTFNAVIAASDLLFAVYRDFHISSNMLAKAAFFRKPLLVSDQYLMGERVRQYGIGLAVKEDDASAMLTGMETIAAYPVPLENFDHYCQDFSSEKINHQLQHMLINHLSKRAS